MNIYCRSYSNECDIVSAAYEDGHGCQAVLSQRYNIMALRSQTHTRCPIKLPLLDVIIELTKFAVDLSSQIYG